MTILEMRESDKVFLTAADVAELLQSDPNSIRGQAHADPTKLGFPVIVIGSYVKIPRIPFLKFIGQIYPPASETGDYIIPGKLTEEGCADQSGLMPAS